VTWRRRIETLKTLAATQKAIFAFILAEPFAKPAIA
jgi:hypothetical protein